MKRLKCLLTALMLLLCTMDAGAQKFADNGIYYEITSTTDYTCVVSYRRDSYDSYNEYNGNIVIPDSVQYFTWKLAVKGIGEYAFAKCTGVQSVTIPNTVEKIEYGAFWGCTGLKSISIPSSVHYIDASFKECTNLTTVEFLPGERHSSLSLNNEVFDNCTSLKNINLEDIEDKSNGIGLWYIGYAAFRNCTSLTDFEIPNTVGYIYDYAFNGCTGLTSITIPNSVNNLGSEYTFNNCTNLQSVYIGSGVNSGITHGYMFAGCSSLTTVVVDADNKYYDSRNNCNAIIETATNTLVAGCNTTVIPSSVTAIGPCAFIYNKCITNVDIPNSVTSIGANAFSNCTNLVDFTIPESVVEISGSPFSSTGWWNNQTDGIVYKDGWCFGYKGTKKNLSGTVAIKDGTKGILGAAFQFCSNITGVKIPSSVTRIEGSAFYGCTNLVDFTIPETVLSLGGGVFSDTGWYNNQPDGFLYKDGWFLCSKNMYNTGTGLAEGSELVIPDGIKRIAGGAANGFGSRLVKLTIPESVVSIGDYAFSDDYITEVVIPNSVTTIGNGAFSYNTKLESLTIGRGVTKIGADAFNNTWNLNEIYCLAAVPPALSSRSFYSFWDSLTVPAGSLDNYRNDASWGKFNTIQIGPWLTINDGEEIVIEDESVEINEVVYKRTFANTGWQPWYMPFDVELSDVENELEVACLNNVHQYDDNKDGEIDRTELEAISLVEGTLSANYPYIVRAKSTGTKNFVFDNVTIEPFENNSYDCSSLSTKFIFTGYNNAIDYNSSYYELENDCLAPVTNTVTKLTQLNNDKVYTLRSARAFLLYSSNVPDEICSSNGWSVGDVSRDINDVNQHFKIKSINGKYYLYSVAAGKYVNVDGEFVANATDALVFENVGGEYQWKLGVGNHVLNSQEWDRAASGMRVDDWTTTDEGNCYIIEEARTTLAPNRWYLSVEARSSMHKAPAQIRLFVRDGDATAIEEVEAPCNGQDGSPVIYDLSGRRVENPTKGIYIVNGNKVILK